MCDQGDPQDPRNMVMTKLLELQSPVTESHVPRYYHAQCGAYQKITYFRRVIQGMFTSPKVPNGKTLLNDKTQGNERRTYVALERQLSRNCGIA